MEGIFLFDLGEVTNGMTELSRIVLATCAREGVCGASEWKTDNIQPEHHVESRCPISPCRYRCGRGRQKGNSEFHYPQKTAVGDAQAAGEANYYPQEILRLETRPRESERLPAAKEIYLPALSLLIGCSEYLLRDVSLLLKRQAPFSLSSHSSHRWFCRQPHLRA